MLFVYRDSSGQETLRKLTNFKEDKAYIRGYCEYSGGMRTFRKDRIVQHISDESALNGFADIPIPKAAQQRKPLELDEDQLFDICFKGFRADDREGLESLARENTMRVRYSVSSKLDFLCVGDGLCGKAMEDAENKKVSIITTDQFYEFINDGILPDGYVSKEKSADWIPITEDEATAEFAAWSYAVKKAHWSAFGIQWKYFTDPEPTMKLRKAWEKENPRYSELNVLLEPFRTQNKNKVYCDQYKQQHGKSPKIADHPKYPEFDKLRKERLSKLIQYGSFAISNPREYAFEEGDTFHGGQGRNLQVISSLDPLEVKNMDGNGNSIGYHLTEKSLEKWLKDGKVPDEKYVIDKNQSKSAIAQYHEYTQ